MGAESQDIQSESFADWLTRRRAALGLTQRELGDKVGLAWSMISKYEAGQSKPRQAALKRLMAVLEPCPLEPSKPGAEAELDSAISAWMEKNELGPQQAAKLLAIKAARLL